MFRPEHDETLSPDPEPDRPDNLVGYGNRDFAATDYAVNASGIYYIWVIVDVNNEANQSDNSDASDKAKAPLSVTVPMPPASTGDYVQVYSTGTSGLRVRSSRKCISCCR